MASNKKTAADLSAAAHAYVERRRSTPGGWGEALSGFVHKTGPFVLGLNNKLTLVKVVPFAIRTVLLVGAAMVPVVARRLGAPSSDAPQPSFDLLWLAAQKVDRVDLMLVAAAVLFTGLPKVLDVWGKRTPATTHGPYYELSASVDAMPELPARLTAAQNEKVQQALTFALRALRDELSLLTNDQTSDRATNVTLLEFCDPEGKRMQVRARTAAHEPTGRPIASGSLLAYYVARGGRWFAVHDFMQRANPFPKTRVTVPHSPPVDYRSVLYLPLLHTVKTPKPVGLGKHGAPEQSVEDRCMGVICVHSAKAYRFWRWGDHRKKMSGFGDVAYARSLPYISVVTRLLENTAHKVKLEVE